MSVSVCLSCPVLSCPVCLSVVQYVIVSEAASLTSSITRIFSLPPEILLQILSYVPARHVILSVTLVCHHFLMILTSCSTWRSRYTALGVRRRPAQAATDLDTLGWKKACVEQEEAVSFWGSQEMMENNLYCLAGKMAAAHIM